VAELFIFGPPLVLGTIIVLLGRRYVLRAGLTRREAWLTAGLAGLAGAAGFFAFVIEWLLYAVGEHEGDYYNFSTYMEYRQALDSWTGFAAALGYGLLAAGLALAAGVVWRRAGAVAGVALALAACASVTLPFKVPTWLDRVEYGRDPVLHPVGGGVVGCFEYSVEGLYPPPAQPQPAPVLCLRSGGTADAMLARVTAEELNDAGIEPYDEVDNADWTRP
jgi:hypothetical protein